MCFFPESYRLGYEEMQKKIDGASHDKLATLRAIAVSCQLNELDRDAYYFWLGGIRAIDSALWQITLHEE